MFYLAPQAEFARRGVGQAQIGGYTWHPGLNLRFGGSGRRESGGHPARLGLFCTSVGRGARHRGLYLGPSGKFARRGLVTQISVDYPSTLV